MLRFFSNLLQHKAVVGVGGVTAIQAVSEVPPTTSLIEVGKLVVQAVIAIVTIFKLLKKDKATQSSENQLNK